MMNKAGGRLTKTLTNDRIASVERAIVGCSMESKATASSTKLLRGLTELRR